MQTSFPEEAEVKATLAGEATACNQIVWQQSACRLNDTQVAFATTVYRHTNRALCDGPGLSGGRAPYSRRIGINMNADADVLL